MITSIDNNRIKHIRKLLEKSKTRRQEKQFVLEGYKSVIEASRMNLVNEVYLAESADVPEGIEITDTLSDAIFNSLSDTVTPQGILAVVRMPEFDEDEILGRDDCKVICLEDVRDPGNIGTIIRTAEGAGLDAVILSKGCADVFQPKVTRSTMGSVLRVPCLSCNDAFAGKLDKLHDKGFTVYGAYLDGAADYKEPAYEGKVAVLIGNEANGLSDEAVAKCDKLIKIPMKGELESLNAAVSAAILAYEIGRNNN